MIDPDVAAHYGLGFEEGRLLLGDRHRLEFVRTLDLLDRLLPPPPARILDVGGGTGIYALALAARGYTVALVDPVEDHVRRANELAGNAGWAATVTAHLGDARDLTRFGSAYDGVLLMGPLYHLTEASDRALAFGQAMRTVRPGGVVLAIGISRFASLLDGLKRKILGDPTFGRIVEGDLRDGQHRNPNVIGAPEFFTTAYFHLPDELEQEALAAGLANVQLLAVEGPAWLVEDIEDLDNQVLAARAIESERSLMGATSHFLVAGSRPP